MVVHTSGLQQHEVTDVDTLVTTDVVVVEVVVITGKKELETTVVGTLAVIVSATVTVSTTVATAVDTNVTVCVVNGPVGTLLVTIPPGPPRHNAHCALVQASSFRSFINKNGGGKFNFTNPQSGV